MTEAQVADLVVDLIEDEALVNYRDAYLKALDEFGWQVDEGEPADEVQSFASEDSLGSGAANALDLSEIEGEPHTDALPATGEQETAAVAEKEEVV